MDNSGLVLGVFGLALSVTAVLFCVVALFARSDQRRNWEERHYCLHEFLLAKDAFAKSYPYSECDWVFDEKTCWGRISYRGIFGFCLTRHVLLHGLWPSVLRDLKPRLLAWMSMPEAELRKLFPEDPR